MLQVIEELILGSIILSETSVYFRSFWQHLLYLAVLQVGIWFD